MSFRAEFPQSDGGPGPWTMIHILQVMESVRPSICSCGKELVVRRVSSNAMVEGTLNDVDHAERHAERQDVRRRGYC